MYTFRDAMQEFVADDGLQERYSNGAQETMPMKTALVRGGGIIWTLGVIAYMINAIGVWPFISYTLQGWTMLTARFLCTSLGFNALASVLRLPSLIMNGVTVLVWWLLLFPVFMTFMNDKARKGFMKFNSSPLLINLHFLNLPLALLDVWLSPRSLNTCDLWFAFAFLFLYSLFYFLVLDANGLHIYVVFSPRSAIIIPTSAIVFALYILLYRVSSAYSLFALQSFQLKEETSV